MTIKTNDRAQTLQLTANGHIVLTVSIGNAQLGASIVTMKGDANIIAKGDITKLDLGAATDLKGKTLNVLTNTLDTNDASNAMITTYTFSGTSPAIAADTNTVDSDGDVYSLSFDFTFN